MFREPISLTTWLLGVAGTMLLLAIVLPLLGTKSDCGMDTRRQSNMRVLMTAMHYYAAEHDGQLFPPDQWHAVMDPWLGVGPDDPVYFPDYNSRFMLLPIPWDDMRLPADLTDQDKRWPFMYAEQHLMPGETAVAFWDGSVRLVDDEQFAQLIDTSRGVPIGVRVPHPTRVETADP